MYGTTIRLLVSHDAVCPIEETVRQLSEAFPGTRIESTDSFTDEKHRTLQLLREIEEKEGPLQHKATIVADIENRRAFFGPGIDIVVPVTDHKQLAGHIWAKDIFLRSIDQLQACDVEKIIEILRMLDIGELEVYRVK